MSQTGIKSYYFRALLSGTEWLKNVCLQVTDSGLIHSITANTPPQQGEPILSAAIPSMSNVHSHAFQRGFAGLSEFTLGGENESFWTWRELMYKFANSLDEKSMTVIASQAYIEMVKAGYTTVGEFHYLHNKNQNKAVEMAKSILKAGEISGIAVTLLPVFYQVSDFLKDTPTELQKPFIHTIAEFNTLLTDLSKLISSPNCLGTAFHSLRAVPIENIPPVLSHIKQINTNSPIHIHISEQVKEVEGCITAYKKAPIELLFSKIGVDKTWCLIHATQTNDKELNLMKESGCKIGICPTTEANLGDGVFPAKKYYDLGGEGICIGSDSQICIDPVQELRQLEYSQRLWGKARIVLAKKSKHNGTDLWASTALNGAEAIQQPIGKLEVGKRADLVVLEQNDVIFAGATENELLDAMIFGARGNVVRDVMIGGKWVVVGGKHVNEGDVKEKFMQIVRNVVGEKGLSKV